MEDLTEFVKAAKQREDDIKDGKIYPYEKRKLLKEEQDKLDQGIYSSRFPRSVIKLIYEELIAFYAVVILTVYHLNLQ